MRTADGKDAATSRVLSEPMRTELGVPGVALRDAAACRPQRVRTALAMPRAPDLGRLQGGGCAGPGAADSAAQQAVAGGCMGTCARDSGTAVPCRRCWDGAEPSGRRAALRAQSLLNCLMYKLSYYRFGEGALMATGRMGFDRVRQARALLRPSSGSPASGHAPGCMHVHDASAGLSPAGRLAPVVPHGASVSAGVSGLCLRTRLSVFQCGLASRAPPLPSTKFKKSFGFSNKPTGKMLRAVENNCTNA